MNGTRTVQARSSVVGYPFVTTAGCSGALSENETARRRSAKVESKCPHDFERYNIGAAQLPSTREGDVFVDVCMPLRASCVITLVV
jgi:hypothetical protein